MFQQAGLCKAPPAGKKNKNHILQQLTKWEKDPLVLWTELKAKQAARPRGAAGAVDTSPAARGAERWTLRGMDVRRARELRWRLMQRLRVTFARRMH